LNHYFDDIFSRHVYKPRTTKPPYLVRRSSTTRSIGARSDFDRSGSADGDGNEDFRSVDSTETETAEKERERREADEHTANYVWEQLSRVRSNQSADFETGDEFEAQLDGK
jgi:hypothetical protein